MLDKISSIPSTVRQGLEVVQDLPHRASSLSESILSQVFGGCRVGGQGCSAQYPCCYTNPSSGKRLVCRLTAIGYVCLECGPGTSYAC